jgi:hypothetical protein
MLGEHQTPEYRIAEDAKVELAIQYETMCCRIIKCYLEFVVNSVRLLTVLASLHLARAAVFAQAPTLDSGNAPHIDLTAAQKQTVYQSISKTQKNNAGLSGNGWRGGADWGRPRARSGDHR